MKSDPEKRYVLYSTARRQVITGCQIGPRAATITAAPWNEAVAPHWGGPELDRLYQRVHSVESCVLLEVGSL